MRGRAPSAGAGLSGLDEVVTVTAPVAAAFSGAGYRLYLVGGVVRDLALGAFAVADDIDLTTDARPEAIKKLVAPSASAVWTPGERFGTVGATVGGRNLEITTHRAESYDPQSRKPIVTFGRSIDEDLSRRDFTINAMALSLPDLSLLDPHGGLADLDRGVLRTPMRPEMAFGDDPLRMLRAARFLPRFDLDPEPGLEAAAKAMADRLSIVSVERIHDELERLLAVDDPGRGFGFLGRTGLLVQVVPALAGRVEAQIEAIALASGPGSILARRAGLLAPLGAEAAACLRRLRYDRSTANATMSLLQVLDTVVGPAGGVDPGTVGDGTVRQVIDLVGFDRVDDLRRLAHNLARYRATQRPEPCGDPGDGGGQDGDLPFFERVDELAGREDLSSFTSPLSGRQVMAHLGVEPGPLVGDAVDHLRQQRLSDGPLSAEAAYELLDEWWRQLPGAGDSTPGTAADGN